MLDSVSQPDLVGIARATAQIMFRVAAEADAAASVAPEASDALRRSGLIQAPLAAAEGGADLASLCRSDALCGILCVLGGADLNWARLYEGHVNAVALVERYGTSAQREAFAARVRDGALSGVWGADDRAGLRAERDGDTLRLWGRKILASGAGLLTCPLITAAHADGPVLILLDLAVGERADLSDWTPQGMRSSATGSITLDGMSVALERIVGRPGDFLRQPSFSGGAWRFCAAQLGAVERLVDLFRNQLVARGRGEDPYQLQRVAQAVAAATTARFWVERAASLVSEETGEPTRIVSFVNLTRMVTERAALDALDLVHRGAGLGSFLRPDPIERIGRDLATYLRQPVPDLAMADAARAVLASRAATGELWPLP